MDLLDWARGPLLYFALTVFVLGVSWRLVALARLPAVALRALGVDFREMTPTAKMNWCCGGGAGAFLINRAAPLRQKAWKIKRSQAEATGAETVVVSCASCRLNFIEGAEVGKSQIHIESLVELVAAQLPRPREVTSQAAGARDV